MSIIRDNFYNDDNTVSVNLLTILGFVGQLVALVMLVLTVIFSVADMLIRPNILTGFVMVTSVPLLISYVLGTFLPHRS